MTRRASLLPEIERAARLPVSGELLQTIIQHGTRLIKSLEKAARDHKTLTHHAKRREAEIARIEKASAARMAEFLARAAECEAEMAQRAHEFSDNRELMKGFAAERSMTVEILRFLLAYHQNTNGKRNAPRAE